MYVALRMCDTSYMWHDLFAVVLLQEEEFCPRLQGPPFSKVWCRQKCEKKKFEITCWENRTTVIMLPFMQRFICVTVVCVTWLIHSMTVIMLPLAPKSCPAADRWQSLLFSVRSILYHSCLQDISERETVFVSAPECVCECLCVCVFVFVFVGNVRFCQCAELFNTSFLPAIHMYI